MRNTRYGLVFLIVFSVFTFGLSNPGNAVTGPTLTLQVYNGLTSLNADTLDANQPTNAQVSHLRRSGFFYIGQHGELIPNTTFGTATILSEKPFKVRYSINKGRVWSDGVPITAADLLVHHISCSSKYAAIANLAGPNPSSSDADFKSTCYGGIYDQRVLATPTVSSDKLSITVEYDKFFPEWAQVSPMPFPAHTLVLLYEGKTALPDLTKADALKGVFEKAVGSYDRTSLLAYAKLWSYFYNLTDISASTNPLLLVSNGGYIVESAVANQSVSLVYNEKYNSGPQVQGIARINFRVIADGNAAAQALANREIDILEAVPTADGVSSLRNLSNVRIYSYSSGPYEHLDLRVSAAKFGGEPYSGVFAGNSTRAQDLRRAFLLAFPRDQIVEKLITPINPQAKPLNSLFYRSGESNYSDVVAKNGISAFTQGSQSVREAQALDLVKKYFPSASDTNPQVKVNLLWGTPTNSRRLALMALAKASLARAGFDLSAPGLSAWSTQLRSSNYDAAIFAWARADGSTERNLDYYSTEGGSNNMGYSDASLDYSLSMIRNTNLADNSRLGTFVEAENQIYKNSWSLPLFEHPAAFAANSSLGNFKPGSSSLRAIWNYWELTLPGAKPFELFGASPAPTDNSSNKPTTPTFSGINFVGNKINISVNIGSNAANLPDKIYLVAPKLGVLATNPLAGAISGNIATWTLEFNKSLAGVFIPFEIVSEKNGVKSDPATASYQAPTAAGATTSVPPTPTQFKSTIVGGSAVITAEVKIQAGALATNAFLVSKELGFTSARPLKGEVAGSKFIAQFAVKSSMAGKKFPVSIYVTNSKGKSKSLAGVISIPKAPTAPKAPTSAPDQTKVNCKKGAQERLFDGSCPPGWEES